MSHGKPDPKPTLLQRLRHDRGATIVEYVVLVGIVAMGVIAGWRRARERENNAVAQQAQVVARLEGSLPNGAPPPGLPPPLSGGGPSPPPGTPPRGGGCFAAGTLVATADGLRPIETVRQGDLLWARDEITGEVGLKPVVTRFVTPTQPVMELRVASGDGGEIIRPTPGHPFWATGQGWVEAKDLSIHEALWAPTGEPLHLAAPSETEFSYETVYNFEVADFHSYFVGQHRVLVHNAQPPRGGSGGGPPANPLPGNPCSAFPPGGPSAADLARLQELAKDPAQGGKITAKTMQEARVGLDLEKSGRLAPPIKRDPTGGAEFIDGNGQAWDVKGFNSAFPNGYELNAALTNIGDSIRDNENVIVDTSKMTPADIAQLKAGVTQSGWDSKVIFWP